MLSQCINIYYNVLNFPKKVRASTKIEIEVKEPKYRQPKWYK